jgi:hypothetical protein
MEAFDTLVSMPECAERPLMPLDQFQQKFHAALTAAGYGTREQIIELVREVKQERVLAKHQQSREPDSAINK